MCDNTNPRQCVRCAAVAKSLGDVVPWEFAIQGGNPRFTEWLCDDCGRDLTATLIRAMKKKKSK